MKDDVLSKEQVDAHEIEDKTVAALVKDAKAFCVNQTEATDSSLIKAKKFIQDMCFETTKQDLRNTELVVMLVQIATLGRRFEEDAEEYATDNLVLEIVLNKMLERYLVVCGENPSEEDAEMIEVVRKALAGKVGQESEAA
tara:strand:- start:1437 stop:1859 length:423 start_codon:yes stop_codon:yes gene_type:complete